MELLSATYCPYCKSRLEKENILENVDTKDTNFYLTCTECEKTFKVYAKIKVKVNVNSIEKEIEREKDSFLFWKQAKMKNKEFQNNRIAECEELIQKLETIKAENDKEVK